MITVDGTEMEIEDAKKYLRKKKKEEKILEEQMEFARIDAEHELYHVLNCLDSEMPDNRFFFRGQGHKQTTTEDGWLCIHVEKQYGKGIIRYCETYTEVAWYIEHTNGQSFLACRRDRQTGELAWLLLGAYGNAAAGVPIQNKEINDKLTAIARKVAADREQGDCGVIISKADNMHLWQEVADGWKVRAEERRDAGDKEREEYFLSLAKMIEDKKENGNGLNCDKSCKTFSVGQGAEH